MHLTPWSGVLFEEFRALYGNRKFTTLRHLSLSSEINKIHALHPISFITIFILSPLYAQLL
jgi:hypothetical protein